MEAQSISPTPQMGHAPLEDNTLLIVDDDRAFLARLARAMETRGFAVEAAASVEDGLSSLRRRPPAFAVVDMRLDDGNGIDVIAALKEVRPDARAVVLTGYGNIATAVTAVKLGAVDYLAKPADADDVYNALVNNSEDSKAPPPRTPCLPTACVGSTFSGSTSFAIATSRRLRAGSTCTGARYSAFSPNAPPSRKFFIPFSSCPAEVSGIQEFRL